MLGQEREKKYSLVTFPFQKKWAWVVRAKKDEKFQQGGRGFRNRDAAYWAGKNWLRRHERRQAKEKRREKTWHDS